MKKLNSNDKAYISAILLLAILSLLALVCKKKENKEMVKIIYKERAQVFTKQTRPDSSALLSQRMYFESKLTEANIDLLETKLMLKEAQEIIKIKSEVNLHTSIKLANALKGQDIGVDTSMFLKLPVRFQKDSKWLSLTGNIDSTGRLNIERFKTPFEFTYAIGDTLRSGIFNRIVGKKDKVVRLHIDNPYVQIKGLDNIYIKQDKKWFQKTSTKIGAGAILGAAAIIIFKK